MVKLLYDLGNDCFKVSENPEKIGAGIILLQDSVELFLIALCEHLKIVIGHNITFNEYFVKLEQKTTKDTPLKTQIVKLNKQRVSVKHHGVLPHVDECRAYHQTVKNFFDELSTKYLDNEFDSITLMDLLEEGEQKDLLKEAERFLRTDNYKSCIINCRKVLYLSFEKKFDIKMYDTQKPPSLWTGALGSLAPHFARNKKYIDANVKEPRDYISIDYRELEMELHNNDILPVDFWNLYRLTPEVYYENDAKEWIVVDDFSRERYTAENAEYCFRKIVDILLLLQRRKGEAKWVSDYGKCIKLKDREGKVFAKATTQSTVIYEFKDYEGGIFSMSETRGLRDKKKYYKVTGNIKSKYLFGIGYICEDNVELYEK